MGPAGFITSDWKGRYLLNGTSALKQISTFASARGKVSYNRHKGEKWVGKTRKGWDGLGRGGGGEVLKQNLRTEWARGSWPAPSV